VPVTNVSNSVPLVPRNSGSKNPRSGELVQGMPAGVSFLLKSSYGRPMLREFGPNKIFLTFLFCDQAMAIQFLKNVGLLRSKVQCNTCAPGQMKVK